MPLPKKSLKNRLMNYKYYYTYGLFDIVRRRDKNLLAAFSPEILHTVADCDAVRCDSLILVGVNHPVTQDREQGLVPVDEKKLVAE